MRQLGNFDCKNYLFAEEQVNFIQLMDSKFMATLSCKNQFPEDIMLKVFLIKLAIICFQIYENNFALLQFQDIYYKIKWNIF